MNEIMFLKNMKIDTKLKIYKEWPPFFQLLYQHAFKIICLFIKNYTDILFHSFSIVV